MEHITRITRSTQLSEDVMLEQKLANVQALLS